MSILSRVKHERTKRLCMDACLVAFAMMLSYLEAVLPLQAIIPLPGFRLGLANVAVMATFCLFSPVDAACVSAIRILLVGLLFGSATSLYFSALGGLCSFLMLLLLRYVGKRLSFIGASVLCAAAHNTGQIIAAVTLFGTGIVFSYLSLLLIASAVYGGVVGLLLNLMIPRLEKRVRGRGES